MTLNANVLVDELGPESQVDARNQIATGRGRLVVKRFLRNKAAVFALSVVNA